MKITICFAILIVCVYGEYCNHDSDCTLTVCGSNSRKDCFERDGSHVCTCVPTTSSGTDNKEECDNSQFCERRFGDCNHFDHKWHCIRHTCRCGFFG